MIDNNKGGMIDNHDKLPISDPPVKVKVKNEYLLETRDVIIEGDLIVAETIADVRNLSQGYIDALKSGKLKGVQVLGYYKKGDTPAPIVYYISSTSATDDGGSVFEVGGVKLEHVFNNSINAYYFGVKADGVTDDLTCLIKARDYVEARADVISTTTRKNGGKLVCYSDKSIVITNTFSTSKIIDLDLCTILYKGSKDKTAVHLEGLYNSVVRIKGVIAELPAVLSNSNFKGIVIKNSLRCRVYIDKVKGFTTNYELLADNYGCAWIDTYMVENQASLNHIVLRNLGSLAWTNANTFSNLECSNGTTGDVLTSSVTTDRAYIRITGDGAYAPNTIVFNNTCRFEGGSNVAQWNGRQTYLIISDIPSHLVNFDNCRIENINDSVLGKVHKNSTTYSLNLLSIGGTKKITDLGGEEFPLRSTEVFKTFYKSKSYKEYAKTIKSGATDRVRMRSLDGFFYSSGFNYHHSGDGVFGNTFKVVNSPVLRFKSLKRPVIILLDESKNIISDEVLLSKQLDFIRRADSQIKDSLIISTSGSNKYISTPNDRYWDIQIKVIPEAHYVMFATNSITGSLEVDVFENDWNKVELSFIKDAVNINRNAIQLAEAIDNINIVNTDFKVGEEYVNVNTNTYYLVTSISPLRFLTNGLPPNATTTVKGLVNQAVASADTATVPSATYTQAEVQAILTELRDLKNKLRTAGVLAPNTP